MSRLSAEKMERLRALLSTLPAPVPARLIAVAQTADPVLGELLRTCLEGEGSDEARESFFSPLAPVSGDPQTEAPSRCYTPAPMLRAIWDWMGEALDPEAVAAARAVAARPDAAESAGLLDEARARVAQKIEAAVAETRDDRRARKLLQQRFGTADFARLSDAAAILNAAPVLRAAFEGLPEALEDVGEETAHAIRERYEAASAEQPAAGAWFLFLLMARFQKPWKIMRLFEVIAGRNDDLLVSRTDMAAIGDALLGDAEHFLQGFSRSPRTIEEAEAAVAALERFSSLTVGMTREFGIRKDGPWGKRLFELRARAASNMEDIHARAARVFETVAPDTKRFWSRGGRRRLDDNDYAEAEAIAVFLYGAKDDASRAAVGGSHSEALSNARKRLDDFGRSLVDGLRGMPEHEREELRERLNRTADLLRALGEPGDADVLLRRGAAAAAA